MYLPKVTIITVCYNSEKTIEQTINSVLNQTYTNIEYIIVDGCSTDGTLEIIKKYRDHIHLISEPDDGLYHAMNKGIMKSSGDIIGIINSDDWYEYNAVDMAVRHIFKNSCDLIYGKCMHIHENGLMYERKCGNLEELKYRMVIEHPTVFVKKRVYEKYGIFNQKYKIAADYDLMLRFYESGIKMLEVPEVIAYFRMSGISANYFNVIKEFKEIALSHWDGESLEVREEIEKYANCRLKVLKIQTVMAQENLKIDEIISGLFSDKNEVVIFGAGDFGFKCMQFLRKNGCSIDFFVDNDTQKWNSLLAGIKIMSPDLLLKEHKNVIIANAYYEDEIKNQLEHMGYSWGIDFVCIGDILVKVKGIDT